MIPRWERWKKMWPEWTSTHQCTIPKIPFWDFMDGMKLSPRGQFTWSLFIFFTARFFFPSPVLFFSLGTVLLSLFIDPPLTPSFFGKLLLPTPTYLPPFFLPTHLPPSSCWPPPHPPPFALTSTAKASDLERAWVAQSQSLRSTKSTIASRFGSFKSAPARGASTWWQQERESKRSFKVVAKVGPWR
jgi:hypothetical protein